MRSNAWIRRDGPGEEKRENGEDKLFSEKEVFHKGWRSRDEYRS